jgi:hypothetical protein
MKLIAFLFIFIILISLFSALLSIIRSKGSTQVAKALTVRIALSLILFIFLMVSFYTGMWTPHQV